MSMADLEQPDLTGLTVQLLSAYVSNNTVASEDLAKLIRETRAALTDSDEAKAPVEEEAPVHVPAVSIRKSLASRDHIISLIDGKPYKTLKRHLASHGLTPVEYRERYSLSKSYPIVAPNYSAARRETAARIGLGRKPRAPEGAMAPAPVQQTASVTEAERKKKPARGKAVKAAETTKRANVSKVVTTAVEKVSPVPVAIEEGAAAIVNALEPAVTKAPRKSATKSASAKALRAKATKTARAKKVGPITADVAAGRVPPASAADAPEPVAAKAPRKSAAKPASKKAAPSSGRDKTAIAGTAANIARAPKKKLGIRTVKTTSAAETLDLEAKASRLMEKAR